MSLVSSGASFAGFLKLTQYIEMLLYFNVAYPSNFQAFLSFFSQNLFDFMYNPFEKLSDLTCDLEHTYMNNGVECLFLQNAGQIYVITAGLIVLKYLSKLLQWSTKKLPRLSRVLGKPDDYLNTSAWFMLFDGVMFDMLLAASINIRKAKFVSFNVSLNAILSYITAGLYLIETPFCICYIYYFHKQKVCSELKQSIQRLTGKVSLKYRIIGWIKGLKVDYYTAGKNEAYFVGRYSVAIFKVRSLVTVPLLLAFFSVPTAQVGSIAALHGSTAVLLLFWRPSSSKLENFKVLVSEVCLAVSMSIAAVMSDSSVMPSQKHRYRYLGFSLIITIGVLFIINIASSVAEAVMSIREMICSKKVQPVDMQPSTWKGFNKVSDLTIDSKTNASSTILSKASTPKRLNVRKRFTRVISQSPTLKK